VYEKWPSAISEPAVPWKRQPFGGQAAGWPVAEIETRARPMRSRAVKPESASQSRHSRCVASSGVADRLDRDAVLAHRDRVALAGEPRPDDDGPQAGDG
jgi:hypothetical protein